jgi:MOSC domain-containing protein YiiM
MAVCEQADGVPFDKEVIKTISKHANRHAGVYGRVDRAGTLKVGDSVEYEPDARSAIVRAADSAGSALKRAAVSLAGKTILRG